MKFLRWLGIQEKLVFTKHRTGTAALPTRDQCVRRQKLPSPSLRSQRSALLWGQEECWALIVLDFDKRQSALCLWGELAKNLGRSVS